MRKRARFFSHRPVAASWWLVVGALLVLLIPTSLALSQGGNPAGRLAGAAPSTASAGNLTWQTVVDKPTVRWYNLEFVGRNVAYAVGANGWDGPHVPATLAKTTDGGNAWATSTIAESVGFLAGLECKDASTCWVAGRGGTNLKTTNGGSTWRQARQRRVFRLGIRCYADRRG